MSHKVSHPILHRVRQLLEDPTVQSCSDETLLQQYLDQRDDTAFETIVLRHGPMVLDVCRSVLHNDADAEDAFQATFLILTRSARSIRKLGTLGCWLHGVAYRTSLKARSRFATQRKHESQVRREECRPADDLSWKEVRQIVHEELADLSDRHRVPLVLCYLQGKTQDEAASLLDMSRGTLKRRLERGRALLRDRLVRRGMAPAIGLLTAAWPSMSSAASIPPTLLASTIQASTSLASGSTAAMSARVEALLEGGTALSTSMKMLVACTLSIVVVGLTMAFYPAQGENPHEEQQENVGPVPAEAPSTRPKRDRHGDALPEKAFARLGTHRFRSNGWIDRVAVMPDGKRVLGLGGRFVFLWDATTGKEVRRVAGPTWRETEDGGASSVHIESFAVSQDGKTLAAGTRDNSKLHCPILLFDIDSGKKLGQLQGHKGGQWFANPHSVFVTPTLLVSAGVSGPCRVWDVKTRTEERLLEGSERARVSALIAAEDGKHVYLCGRGKKSTYWGLWDATTGKIVYRHDGLPDGFISMARSPDGKTIAISLGIGEIGHQRCHNEIRLCSAKDGIEQRRWQTHAGLYPQRNYVAFSPDGKRIATGGADQKIRQWNPATGKPIGEPIETYVYANKVGYLDAETMYSHGSQNVLRLWDAKTAKPKREFAGGEAHLTALDYSPAGRYVACAGGGGDATIHVWEVATSRRLTRLQKSMSDVTCLKFSPDGRQIACSNSSGTAYVWNWATGKELRNFPGHRAWVHAIAFDPEGKHLATGDNLGIIRIWDIGSGKLLHTLEGHTAHTTDLCFASDGRTLYSSGWDHSIRCWNVKTGKQVWGIKGKQGPNDGTKPVGHTNVVYDIALSPGGEWLYSGSGDHRICVWESATGKLAQVLKGQSRGYSSVNAVALSPDGVHLAAALGDEGEETHVHLWNVLTGKKLDSLRGHIGKVNKLVFAPDGRRLASCSVDTTVLVWDTASLRSKVEPRKREIGTLWDDLGADAEQAYNAVRRGALSGNATIPLLRAKLRPVKKIEMKDLTPWIEKLESDDFAVRERATMALEQLGLGAEQPLRRLRDRAESAEVTTRLAKVLSRFESHNLRASRALEVLTMIGTPEAKQFLREFSQGANEAALMHKARTALKNWP